MATLKIRHAHVDVLLGAEIRRLREAANVSQEKLGDALGITFQQIQKYEKGANRVSVAALLPLATALQASPIDIISVLMTEVPSEAGVAPVARPVNSAISRLSRRLGALPVERQSDIAASLHRILDSIVSEIEVAAEVAPSTVDARDLSAALGGDA